VFFVLHYAEPLWLNVKVWPLQNLYLLSLGLGFYLLEQHALTNKREIIHEWASVWSQKCVWCPLHLSEWSEVEMDVNYNLLNINLKVFSIAVKVTCVTVNKESWENKVIKKNFLSNREGRFPNFGSWFTSITLI